MNKTFEEIKSIQGADDRKEHLPSDVKKVAQEKEKHKAELKERMITK